jgi:antitoxin HicB
MKLSYTVVLRPESTGGFSVLIPTLPGAATQGDTFEQAIDHARDGIDSFIAIYAEDGLELPTEFAPGFAVNLEAESPSPLISATAA